MGPIAVRRVAAIALGSNLESRWGDRAGNLREAVARVGGVEGRGGLGRVVALSPFRDTAPVGLVAQPRFLNAAMLLETDLEPEALLRALLEIERGMGRDRAHAPAKGPRVIDLDLLLMGEMALRTAELTLPHPAMAARPFVLEPLAEIAPGMVHPLTGRTVAETLKELRAGGLTG